MAKKQRNLDYLMSLTKQGIKAFNIFGKKFTEDDSFDIVTVMIILTQNPVIVTSYVVPLLQDLVKQYNEDIIKISIDILNTPQMIDEENMRHFSLYLLGKNFEGSYNKMSTDEQGKYILNIAQGFGIYGEDRVYKILNYLTDLIDAKEDTSDTIKMIAVSDFEDNEIDYMMLLRGLF